MSQIKVSKMDVNTAWEIPWKCWELMKTNYGLALGVALTSALAMLVQNIPVVGAFLSAPLLIATGVGTLFVAKDWESGDKSSYSRFMEKAFDGNLLRPILPLIIVTAILASISQFAVNDGLSLGSLSTLSFIIMIIGFVINLTVIQMVLHPETTISVGFNNSIAAIKTNLVPLVCTWFFYWILAMISMVLLFFPLIFAFLPAATSFPYIVYRVILEGLEIKDQTPEPEI